MIDDHLDPGSDPLAGRDPHPRERVDLWPLHDARQELLEEIVSQPGPGQSTDRSKVLLPVVGVAAALALVAGGAWAATGGSGGSGERGDGRDDVVAATSDDPATETTATTIERMRKDRPREVRLEGVTIGTVETLGRCADRRPVVSEKELDAALRLLPEELKRTRRGHERLYLIIDDESACRLVVRPDRDRKGHG